MEMKGSVMGNALIKIQSITVELRQGPVSWSVMKELCVLIKSPPLLGPEALPLCPLLRLWVTVSVTVHF